MPTLYATDPLLLPATELLRAYASKALTPTQVVAAALERIEHLIRP
jgi:hypothetical protein